jgi:hypothetical protein
MLGVDVKDQDQPAGWVVLGPDNGRHRERIWAKITRQSPGGSTTYLVIASEEHNVAGSGKVVVLTLYAIMRSYSGSIFALVGPYR